jgi:hypothetical protein
MKSVSIKRLGGIVAGSVVGLVGFALPASALSIGGITVSPTPTVHVEDCRSVALARAAGYDMDFSSKTTGPMPLHVAAVADASLTLCWSLDVAALSNVNVAVHTYGTVEGVVNGILTGTDGSGVCTAIRLTVGPGVHGTVTAVTHAHLLVDGAPPADWDNVFTEDLVIPDVGEDISLSACVDSSGSVSAS